MSERVVDMLEVVDIDEDHRRQGVWPPMEALERVLEAVGEQGPVWQPVSASCSDRCVVSSSASWRSIASARDVRAATG